MKMTQEHYQELESLVNWLNPVQIESIKEDCVALGKSDAFFLWTVWGLTTTRFLNLSKREFFAEVFGKYQDTHLETALKKILKNYLEN